MIFILLVGASNDGLQMSVRPLRLVSLALHIRFVCFFGMAVVAPDYLGMSGWTGSSDTLHSYFVAEPTAIASLDSLRALQNTLVREDIALDVNPDKVVVWGV